MKTLLIFIALLVLSISHADEKQPAFTTKAKSIINAVNVGRFETEKEYFSMLKTACDRSKCNSLEQIKVKEAGNHIVQCNTNYLSYNNLKNSDAKNICEHRQPIFGCDSNATPLLRKMCYSANKYNLSLLKEKELNLKKRLPASK